ncbi:UvrD-helicase domain-containing protein [Pseudoflavonifractor sp. MSJ-30]|uniref:ATP-dependent helicase n=1 Tax=Pseudoflavonifractor sp. MSJ-30 TaxID=2841525 RepID=UPI001C1257D2|nr:UvrD-helicase domain-containing protein [Pseudoflavonifractor sp. MSJ-30]MBU5453283.1 UvrD-helicase domain-containing protein [Pseudoflavonifractor sp. MSJ-30]
MNNELDSRFLAARRNYIASRFSMLNDMQREAVLTTEGPLLLLAGAGSGKTTVLINRIANILRYGRGSEGTKIPDFVRDEDVAFLENLPADPTQEQTDRADWLCALEPANPWNVIAITFTNKAAGEMKERLSNMLGASAEDIWAMTFHAACCRILRRYIDRCGYTSSFTIYDASDSERLMKEILRDQGLDDKTYPPRYVLSVIGRQKDRLISPEEMEEDSRSASDYRIVQIARVYGIYQKRLKDNNALDFDDILYVTVKLLQQDQEVREYYQRKFHYVLVDEYQDTNHVQYLLTELLAGSRRNICVVGDDDQSIYRFRGATIENILSFEEQYPGARVIRLEQNYRSTQSILDAANAVIAHNEGRKGKHLWTDNGTGEPILVYEAENEGAEGNFVASQILSKSRGHDFRNYAILYRTNAQSNSLEYALKRNGIPYRVIGGMRFFERAEIKDMLSYLCVINNRADDLRLNRIINNPPRGLGAKTIETVQKLAEAEGKSIYEVVCDPYNYGPLEKAAQKLLQFSALIEELAGLLANGMSLPEFYDELLLRTGYADMLLSKPTEENKTKLENVKELKSSIQSYLANTTEPTLSGFLEEISLYTDLEQYNEGDDAVVMMTIHSAKGLEFPHVFLVGFEDGLFPGMRAIGDRDEMEEERRLCYVAITRAKKSLTISHARMRMIYGRTASALPSRFLREIPENCIVKRGGYRPQVQETRRESYEKRIAKGSSYLSSAIRAQTAPSAPMPEFSKGDMVMHAAFGKGMVISVTKMGGDALLEVTFDDIGTKKLMAKAAGAHMKKL